MAPLTGPALILTLAFSFSFVGAVILNDSLILPCIHPWEEPSPEDQLPHQVSLSGCQQGVECKLDVEYPYKLEFVFTPDDTAQPSNTNDAMLYVSNISGPWQQSMLVSGVESGKNSTQIVVLQLAHMDNTNVMTLTAGPSQQIQINVTRGPLMETGLQQFNFCFRIKVYIYTKAYIAFYKNDAWQTGDKCVAKGLPCNFKHSFCEQDGDDHRCECNPNMVEYEGRCLVKPGDFCFSSQECVQNANCDYKTLTCYCAADTTLDPKTGTCNRSAEHKGSFVLSIFVVVVALSKFMF